MNTFASTRQRAAIVLLAGLVTVGACGSEPSDEPGDASGDPGEESTAEPDPSPSDPGSPTEPGERPDDPGDPNDQDDDGRIMPPDGPVEVVWIEDSLYVVAEGSSSCPPKARSVEVLSETEWVIDVTPVTAKNTPCTSDLVPQRSRIAAPANADPDAEVLVTIVDNGERSEPIPVTVQDAANL